MDAYIHLKIYGTWYMEVDSTYVIGRAVDTGFNYTRGGWRGRSLPSIAIEM